MGLSRAAGSPDLEIRRCAGANQMLGRAPTETPQLQ